MSEQLLTDGDVIEVRGVELECVMVSYRERDGRREMYTYAFRPRADMDAEREEQRLSQESAPEPTNEEEGDNEQS